ncbi:uncharacterized protein LOC134243820, partial [Saccostrea cucullata]|uniref:uncharacterized protein LOC134243820 n=1 Tax=Saccostrea cuccullata TaxID=36930 RepID=UPI002ED02567
MPSSTKILHDAISDKTPVDVYATIKTEEETGLRHNEDELDDGVYHTLTLRVTRYEEPVTKKRLVRRYSDSSSTYMKSSACNLIRSKDNYDLFYECKRSSSLRIKNIERKDNCRENIPAQTMEDEERDNFVTSSTGKESVPLPFEKNYIYDVANCVEHDKAAVNLNHKELFLKELSSHLLHFKKICPRVYISEDLVLRIICNFN